MVRTEVAQTRGWQSKQDVWLKGIEMIAQWLSKLTALPKVPGSIPSTHVVAHNFPLTPVPGDLTSSSEFNRHHVHTHKHMKTHTSHIELNK